MNEFLAGCIREHIAKSEKGCGISHRLCWHLFMKRISGIRERTGSAGQRSSSGTFWKITFLLFLFCYHTWGNTSQVLGLTRDDIHLDEKGISTDYVYKGERISIYV